MTISNEDGGAFVDERTLKLLLRAEFAEFQNRIEKTLRDGLDDKISQADHVELEKRVDRHDGLIDGLVAWRNRLIGAYGVIVIALGVLGTFVAIVLNQS